VTTLPMASAFHQERLRLERLLPLDRGDRQALRGCVYSARAVNSFWTASFGNPSA
jgi:hypothetical protein